MEDARGSSSFFPAWRAYAYSQWGKAGAQALYHWVFTGDRQYGEYNTEDSPAHLQIGYWIDLWLRRYFAMDGPAQLLEVKQPDGTGIEVLAVHNKAGTSILLANHRVADEHDHNGKGQPVEVILDLADLIETKPQKLAHLLSFEPTTSAASGPAEVAFPLAPKIKLTILGYGVTLLHVD
jgi:hypothetical protein